MPCIDVCCSKQPELPILCRPDHGARQNIRFRAPIQSACDKLLKGLRVLGSRTRSSQRHWRPAASRPGKGAMTSPNG